MPARHPVAALCLVLAASLAGCASAPPQSPAVPASATGTTVEGSIVSIDTSPWAYDGNAVIAIDTDRGRVAAELPARWNLCQAGAVDVEALRPGLRVRATGAADGQGGLVVCQDPTHGIVPLR